MKKYALLLSFLAPTLSHATQEYSLKDAGNFIIIEGEDGYSIHLFGNDKNAMKMTRNVFEKLHGKPEKRFGNDVERSARGINCRNWSDSKDVRSIKADDGKKYLYTCNIDFDSNGDVRISE